MSCHTPALEHHTASHENAVELEAQPVEKQPKAGGLILSVKARRRSRVVIGAVAVLACLAALASYLYVRYVDVVRFSAEHGRCRRVRPPPGSFQARAAGARGY